MRAGQLVVATPSLTDPSFARTVVLLLQAAPDDGAVGVVLNRPTGTAVEQVLPAWSPLAAEPGVVFTGGPVQPTAAICLGRRRPERLEVPVCRPLEGLAAVGTVDLDGAAQDAARAVDRVRVFAGYAGWSAGQLEGELAEGAWWVLDALPADAFAPDPGQLWRQVLLRQGPPLAFAASYPADPTLN